jgi:ankyrin repeat protein
MALRNAIDPWDEKMVRRFIKVVLYPFFHPGNGMTKFTAAGEGKSLAVVKILAAAATNCSEARTSLSDMLTAAAKKGLLQSVEYLLPVLTVARDKEAEQAKYSKDATAEALAAAVEADQLEIAKFLLEEATDLSPQQRGAPLAGTLRRKQRDMFHLLLDHGASLVEPDETRQTPLLEEAWDGDLENPMSREVSR